MRFVKLFFVLFVMGVMFSFKPSSPHHTFSGSGAIAGRTGSPGDNFQTCRTCHLGPSEQVKTGWISSDIPSSGYVPGTTYNITATVSLNSGNKFGFEISPQNAFGTQIGTLVNTGTQTKLVSGTKYITHTSSGTSGSGGTKTWNFQWTAPAAGSGDFTFYGAFLKADGSGNTSGDTVFTSTLAVTEQQLTSIASKSEFKLKLFPNPSSHQLIIEIPSQVQHFQVDVYDLQGKLILSQTSDKPTTSFYEMDIQTLNKGSYVLKLSAEGQIFSSLFTKN